MSTRLCFFFFEEIMSLCIYISRLKVARLQIETFLQRDELTSDRALPNSISLRFLWERVEELSAGEAGDYAVCNLNVSRGASVNLVTFM